MVELVFVIVILGILASIAIPRLAASRDDAQIVKGKADIAAIRMSIAMKRSENLLSGNAKYPDLNGTGGLFSGVLDYPVSGWTSSDSGVADFSFRAENTDITFEYNGGTGIFTCVGKNTNGSAAEKLCNTLTQ